MSETLDQLRTRRKNVVVQAREVVERSSDENRAMSGEEEGQWQSFQAELNKLDERIKNVIDGEQRAKDADTAFAKLNGGPRQDGKRDDGVPTLSPVADELRAFLRGEKGRYYDVMPSGPVNFRTLSKLTAAAGLNTVPTNFYDRLMVHLIETSSVLQAGPTVLNTAGGETLQVPKTTAHSSAAIVTEGAAIAASDPAFGQASLGAYKYGCLIQVSRELLSDTGVDLEGYLAMQAGRALGNALGGHLVTGTGTAQPTGLVTSATLGVTGPVGTSTSFGVQSTAGMGGDLLIDLFYSVISPYRNSSSAAWLVKDSTMGSLRKLKTSQGDYVVQTGISGSYGTGETIMGKPVFTDPGMAAMAANAKSVVFGDFSQYFVRLAGGTRFERSDDFAFNTDLVTFRALLRADAVLVDQTGAVKYLANSAT